MNKSINILIIEPSSIIFEGLVAVLSKSAIPIHVYKSETIDESEFLNKKISLVILNPAVIQHNTRNFINLKNEFIAIKWIALVYAFYDQGLLSRFDAVLSISDPPEAISTLVKNTLLQDIVRETDQPSEILSDREADVLKLLATGHANKEIADKLNISINTVITHRKNISQKTGIKSVSGLTIYAVVKKLISIENIQD